MIEAVIISPTQVLFEGVAKSIIFPGEEGVFEVLPFHKNIISRLVNGRIVLNNEKFFDVKRGIVNLDKNVAKVVVEQS